MRYLAVIFGLFFLASCAEFTAFESAATEKAKVAKDTEARILINSTCAMGIGAWGRLENPLQQCGALLMCGIPCNFVEQSINQARPVLSVPLEPVEPANVE